MAQCIAGTYSTLKKILLYTYNILLRALLHEMYSIKRSLIQHKIQLKERILIESLYILAASKNHIIWSNKFVHTTYRIEIDHASSSRKFISLVKNSEVVTGCWCRLCVPSDILISLWVCEKNYRGRKNTRYTKITCCTHIKRIVIKNYNYRKLH